jgi:hypothetical protein
VRRSKGEYAELGAACTILIKNYSSQVKAMKNIKGTLRLLGA